VLQRGVHGRSAETRALTEKERAVACTEVRVRQHRAYERGVFRPIPRSARNGRRDEVSLPRGGHHHALEARGREESGEGLGNI